MSSNRILLDPVGVNESVLPARNCAWTPVWSVMLMILRFSMYGQGARAKPGFLVTSSLVPGVSDVW